jgi:tRNA(Arg) A34 adenosine deaminase TadA
MTGQASQKWMEYAIALAIENVQKGGGPFAAVVVKENRIISTGANRVTTANDPTAHAEISAIRAAAEALSSFRLDGCELYSSCEPCPMCLGAIFWARLSAYYFSGTRIDAAEAGFDDAFIYDQLSLEPAKRAVPGYRLLAENGRAPFVEWAHNPQRIQY